MRSAKIIFLLLTSISFNIQRSYASIGQLNIQSPKPPVNPASKGNSKPITLQVTLENGHTYRKTGDGKWKPYPTPTAIPKYKTGSCHFADDPKKTDLENLKLWEKECIGKLKQ